MNRTKSSTVGSFKTKSSGLAGKIIDDLQERLAILRGVTIDGARVEGDWRVLVLTGVSRGSREGSRVAQLGEIESRLQHSPICCLVQARADPHGIAVDQLFIGADNLGEFVKL
jgi:hypothetical protein